LRAICSFCGDSIVEKGKFDSFGFGGAWAKPFCGKTECIKQYMVEVKRANKVEWDEAGRKIEAETAKIKLLLRLKKRRQRKYNNIKYHIAHHHSIPSNEVPVELIRARYFNNKVRKALKEGGNDEGYKRIEGRVSFGILWA